MIRTSVAAAYPQFTGRPAGNYVGDRSGRLRMLPSLNKVSDNHGRAPAPVQGRGFRIRSAAADAAHPVHLPTAWRGGAILVLATLMLALLAASGTVQELLADVLRQSHEIIAARPVLGALLFVALAALSAMLAFASIAVLLPPAIYTWGEPLTIMLLWAGWLAGGATTYLAGRYFGRSVVRWLSADPLLKRLEQHVGPSTPIGVVLLLQLALPSEVPGYLLGLIRYRASGYFLCLCFAELAYALAAVRLGSSFVDGRAGAVAGIGLAVAAVSIVAVLLLRKRI